MTDEKQANKQAVVNAIWQDPARVFNCQFRQSGKYWEYLRGSDLNERGKIRLLKVAGDTNIMVFYNGGSRPEKCDVFTYLGDYVLNTRGYYETLTRAAEVYGITLQFTVEEREQLNRQALAREVAASLAEALRLNPRGAAARYLADVRGLNPDKHFGELTEQSIQRAAEVLKLHGKTYTPADFKALGLTAERAAQGYNLVIPYYRDGAVVGFLFRDVTGKAKNKYMFSTGLHRGGYCDALVTGEPAVFVEGEIDAIRLTQAGIKNVVAMGTAQMTEGTAKLLKSRNITQITYVPDLEFDEDGHQKTEIIQRAVDAFLNARVDGEPVVNNLYLAELFAPDGADLRGYKTDADSFGKEHGPLALAEVVDLAGSWWSWELDNLVTWAKAQGTPNVGVFQSKFDAIYNRCVNSYERERIKLYVGQGDARQVFAAFGVTPLALADRDEWKRNQDYNNRVKAAADELTQAVENGANPAVIARIVDALAEAQATNTRDEWERQLSQTWDDELNAIRNQPDTLTTKWTLGNVNRDGKFYKYEQIEFWPADISVFVAPTSHGKTSILFQSALDLVSTTTKTYLYVSVEENKRQLFERAVNCFLNIPTTPNGKTSTGEYCFITGTRKRAIKAVLRGDFPPVEYMEIGHWQDLADQINKGLEQYKTQVLPRLKMVHTDETAESITANVLRFVEEQQAAGVEVGAVFVDYMQLLTSENKSYSRHDELKDVCKALHRLAARLELPVIIAAQLNRQALAEGIDTVTVANIGEGADVERIAHDIYFVWQVDKTKRDKYFTNTQKGGEDVTKWNPTATGDRSQRIFAKDSLHPDQRELKRGYLYVEQMKARDGRTDGWGLFPFDGERGFIGENDTEKMAE